jgi:hypothetical protein
MAPQVASASLMPADDHVMIKIRALAGVSSRRKARRTRFGLE